MNGYLLDTNAVSMFSPSELKTDALFARWLEQQETEEALFLSVVTVHEIEKGIHLLEAKGATSKARRIALFIEGLVAGYGDRILPADIAVSRESGRLEARAISAGYNPGMADATIAGTASLYGLTIITRNIRHFLPFGIPAKSPAELAS